VERLAVTPHAYGMGGRLGVDPADLVVVDREDLAGDAGRGGNPERLLEEIAQVQLEPVGVVLALAMDGVEGVLQAYDRLVLLDAGDPGAPLPAVEEGRERLQDGLPQSPIRPRPPQVPPERRPELEVRTLAALQQVPDRALPLPRHPSSRVDVGGESAADVV